MQCRKPELDTAACENALAPAKDLTVAITDPKKQEAMVIADGDNFSLAIGKKGQNARLASKLTHYKIDIKTTEQAREAGINFRQEVSMKVKKIPQKTQNGRGGDGAKGMFIKRMAQAKPV